MSLVKTPPRRPSTAHKKRTAAHHKQTRRYSQSYWPYLPIALVVGLGIIAHSFFGRPANPQVLGYATDMSVTALLQDTNSQRTANGIGALALNATLNQAAQAKAQDMAANNYWAHTSPSGLTPWYFITQAGYSYSTAGENLAYGFGTAADTLTGWMNSPGHRANILNAAFVQVGFGIVNVPDYQSSGQQTIVVAMYAAPAQVAAPVPAPAPTPTPVATSPAPAKATPAPTKTTAPTPASVSTPTPTTQSASGASAGGSNAQETPAPAVATPKTAKATPVSASTAGSVAIKENTASVSVKRVDLLTSANVAWTQFAVSMVMSVALLVFLLRHSLAWHRVLVRGERFVIHHPVIDVVAVAIVVIAILLMQTSGVIK